MNHQAVLDTFQRPDLPKLGRLELIVAVLSEDAGRDNSEGEVRRFKGLWKQAYDETVAQASVLPPTDAAASGVGDEARTPTQDVGETHQQGTSAEEEPPPDLDEAAARVDYAEESLKGLIINAAQALWDDKDALKVFLGVVRRGEGFVKMADALGESRPANATFYGVESREFEVAPSPARHELVMLHGFLRKHRVKRQWFVHLPW
ncbi:hypothetical protein [Streptomyces sp. SAI-129]|uniref:hypothetical protein n=1 Tax=Streptomyces sp. SAI-129 TaxID=3377727 RepID=UPI003C7B8D04